jgi:hypothetical protein
MHKTNTFCTKLHSLLQWKNEKLLYEQKNTLTNKWFKDLRNGVYGLNINQKFTRFFLSSQ